MQAVLHRLPNLEDITMTRIYTRNEQEIGTGWATMQGALGGIIAGITFALAEMIGSVLLAGNPFFMPLLAMASIPLGTPPPELTPTIGTIMIGIIFHMLFSIVLGIVFALLVVYVAALRTSPTALVIAATVYGAILWPLNFHVLAPLLGRPWFVQMSVPPQFIYHAFFFGTVLGLYLVWALPGRRTG